MSCLRVLLPLSPSPQNTATDETTDDTLTSLVYFRISPLTFDAYRVYDLANVINYLNYTKDLF